MPNIGIETIGASAQDIEGDWAGSPITMTEDGTIDSLTAYLDESSTVHTVGAAIYDDAANGITINLVDESTDSLSFPTSPAWLTFSGGWAGATLSNGVAYQPLIWSSGGAGASFIYYDNTADGDDGNMSAGFGAWTGGPWPATLTSDDESSIFSIYVTYTAAGGAATPKGPLGLPLHGPLAGPIGP